MTAVRILGIDPGSRHTGYGLVEATGMRLRALHFGAISPPAAAPFADRLVYIYRELERLLAAWLPDEVAIEGIFEAKNSRSALLLGHARGVALLAVAGTGKPLHEYAPREVKKALVGSGNAEKRQVQAMVRVLLSMASPIRPLDASDGLAIAICHAHSRRVRAIRSAAAGSPART